jgi:hypothetical protein
LIILILQHPTTIAYTSAASSLLSLLRCPFSCCNLASLQHNQLSVTRSLTRRVKTCSLMSHIHEHKLTSQLSGRHTRPCVLLHLTLFASTTIGVTCVSSSNEHKHTSQLLGKAIDNMSGEGKKISVPILEGTELHQYEAWI